MRRFGWVLLLAALAACSSPPKKDEQVTSPKVDAMNRARIHTELGTAYYNNNQMSVALEEMNEALAADPDFAPAHSQLGLIYMALNEDKLAQQSFERALKIDPADSATNNNYGMFLCQRKRDKEAFKYFMTALKNPLYAAPENAYANAGICAWLQNDDVRAEEWLRKALALQPSLLTRHLRVVSQPSADALWLGARIESGLGDRSALASYGTQLNNRFPDAAQTRAFNEGKYK
jgi:type IV pilus assembly protein PilF